MIAISDDEREWRSQRLPVPEPCEHLHLVVLELLPRAASVALAPAAEVGIDRFAVELETRRKPREDRDERRPVRLACRDQIKGHAMLPRNESMRSRATARFSREFA